MRKGRPYKYNRGAAYAGKKVGLYESVLRGSYYFRKARPYKAPQGENGPVIIIKPKEEHARNEGGRSESSPEEQGEIR